MNGPVKKKKGMSVRREDRGANHILERVSLLQQYGIFDKIETIAAMVPYSHPAGTAKIMGFRFACSRLVAHGRTNGVKARKKTKKGDARAKCERLSLYSLPITTRRLWRAIREPMGIGFFFYSLR